MKENQPPHLIALEASRPSTATVRKTPAAFPERDQFSVAQSNPLDLFLCEPLLPHESQRTTKLISCACSSAPPLAR